MGSSLGYEDLEIELFVFRFVIQINLTLLKYEFNHNGC